ncbi:hypothetical protein DO73_4628 [Burkholderia pseudomallei]|nr:hypothetical protein DO73_4628 [Burkholderia pseudomallei]
MRNRRIGERRQPFDQNVQHHREHGELRRIADEQRRRRRRAVIDVRHPLHI